MSRTRRNLIAEERKEVEMALIEEEVTERSDPFERSEDEEEGEPAGGVVPRRRGRPAIPIQWTRVMLVVPGQEVQM
jgi:hypothetical protein